MNKKISPTLIGGFVVGAFALLVIAVIAFGSGQLFRKTKEFVLYFEGSVNGLHIGAPVKFKGVEIGSVKNILLQLDRNMQVNEIPVVIEIDLEKMTSRGASAAVTEQQDLLEKAIVERGLRGQLMTESLVTGVLYIGLDFFPGTPINLVQKPGEENKYPEIPTIPTTLEQAQDAISRIFSKLEEVDFKGLVKSASDMINSVNQAVNSPALKSTIQRLNETVPKIDEALASFSRLADTLDNKVSGLSANLEQTSDATRKAMQQAEIAIKQTDAALKEAQAAITDVREVIDPESPTFYDLRKSLQEVSAAARSLRQLTNFIERNPRALLFGKPEPQEGK